MIIDLDLFRAISVFRRASALLDRSARLLAECELFHERRFVSAGLLSRDWHAATVIGRVI